MLHSRFVELGKCAVVSNVITLQLNDLTLFPSIPVAVPTVLVRVYNMWSPGGLLHFAEGYSVKPARSNCIIITVIS